MSKRFWQGTVAIGSLLLVQAATAVTVVGHAANGTSSSAQTGIVERGGLVKSYNAASRTLTIDNASYTVSNSTIIHRDPGSSEAPERQLRSGTPVRFNTSAYDGRSRIIEIWILRDAVQRKR